ncbi:MAG: hypothetical protein HY000_00480 [Planctomycetes bacterium]|nr:hypothetical protein [Planctomycetota bacterium]
MRFYTSHLMLFVVIVAVVCGVITQPETLGFALVPLVGGVFVVLPVLGTLELLTPRNAILPNPGWPGTLLVILVGLIGCFAAVLVAAWLLFVAGL